MTDRALVEHITGLPHSRANFKQLVRELGYKGEARVELESALARLAVVLLTGVKAGAANTSADR